MATVKSHAERMPVDLSRFIFATGQIGALKTIDTTLVQPGDGYECEMVGSFRLSPLRRGLALDTKLEFFTFYVPMRYVEPGWTDLLIAGPYGSATTDETFVGLERRNGNYLGIPASTDGYVPGFMHNAYWKIYNNYFKTPTDVDIPLDPSLWHQDNRQCGYPIKHLKSYWTSPLTANYTSHQSVAVDDTVSTFDIRDLAVSESALIADQQRAMFASRYRDIVDMLGGDAPFDTDQRPQLIQRTEMWASGYDVNGTDSQSMGQFSGRIDQAFSHKVPRFFCREHGVIMTVAVCRFPPVHQEALPYLVGAHGHLNYDALVHDPVVASVAGNIGVPYDEMFYGAPSTTIFSMPYQHWMRVPEPDHVDERYASLEGFPFLVTIPVDDGQAASINPADYDQMFQTDQLFHWNMQLKTNVEVQRYLITTRDSLMNDD